MCGFPVLDGFLFLSGQGVEKESCDQQDDEKKSVAERCGEESCAFCAAIFLSRFSWGYVLLTLCFLLLVRSEYDFTSRVALFQITQCLRASLILYCRSITGVILPDSIRSRRTWRSGLLICAM